MHDPHSPCPDLGQVPVDRHLRRIDRIEATRRRLERERDELLVAVTDAGVSLRSIRSVKRSTASRRAIKQRKRAMSQCAEGGEAA